MKVILETRCKHQKSTFLLLSPCRYLCWWNITM